jgi:hypothetical protein
VLLVAMGVAILLASSVALADIIDGTNNDEKIRGTSGGDIIDAMGGDDDIDAASTPGVKDNVIDCGAGTDAVLADPLDDVAADCENVERVPSIAPEMDPNVAAPEEAGLSSGSGEVQAQAFNCTGKTHWPHRSTHYAWRDHLRVATSVETWCLTNDNNLYTTANMYRLRAWGWSFLDDATKYGQTIKYQEVIPHYDCYNASDDFYFKTKSYHRVTNNGNAASTFTAAKNPNKIWCF